MKKRKCIITWITPKKELPADELDIIWCDHSGNLYFGYRDECGWYSNGMNEPLPEGFVYAWSYASDVPLPIKKKVLKSNSQKS